MSDIIERLQAMSRDAYGDIPGSDESVMREAASELLNLRSTVSLKESEIKEQDAAIEQLRAEVANLEMENAEALYTAEDAIAEVEEHKARADKAEAALAKAIAGLKRLGSPEAFVMSKVTNDEERARMFYADEVLASLTEEEVKP